MKKLILILISIFMFYIISVNAAVVQSGVTGNYSVGELVTATLTGAAADKNDEGFYVYVNETNGLLENITFTIPSTSPFVVIVSHTILVAEAPRVNFSGELYVNDVFISRSFFNTTLSGGVFDLDIVDCEISLDIFEQKNFGVECIVENQGNPVINSFACAHVDDAGGFNIGEPIKDRCEESAANGEIEFVFNCESEWCNSGDSYTVELETVCPLNTTSKGFQEICISNNKEIGFASGSTSVGFTITSLADKFIIKKWIDSTEILQPGVFVINEFSSKVQMRKNPADGGGYTTQTDVDWGDLNNTNTSFTREQNGQAFLTAGSIFKIGLLINNTFPDELDFDVFECTLDDDNLTQEAFPLDPQTGEVFGDRIIAHLAAKPVTDEGLIQRLLPPMMLPKTFVGGNDWDVQCKILVHGFLEEFTIESDEFHIYGKELAIDFVQIVTITNVSTTSFNEKITACTDMNVSVTYDYFGLNKRIFTAEYCFEQEDNEEILKCIDKKFDSTNGVNNTISQTFTVPFTDRSGNAEIKVFVYETDKKEELIGRFVDAPHNTFNITVNLTDECRFSDTNDQRVQSKQLTSLQDTVIKLESLIDKLINWLAWMIPLS